MSKPREETRALFYCTHCGAVVSLVADQLHSLDADWEYSTLCKAAIASDEDYGHSFVCSGRLAPVKP